MTVTLVETIYIHVIIKMQNFRTHYFVGPMCGLGLLKPSLLRENKGISGSILSFKFLGEKVSYRKQVRQRNSAFFFDVVK